MSAYYASQQPPGFQNSVSNVALVGAGGRCGKFMTDALVSGGKHKVTAITRPESMNQLPAGLHDVKKVDYDDHAALVDSLRGQDVLIITVAVRAPPDSSKRLVDAAVEAGVKFIMPNEWGTDKNKVQASKDTLLHDPIIAVRDYIQKKGSGQTSWISLSCGFWYEFSLAGTEARYGFDFDKKTLTLFDDGETKINTTTFPQVGRAVVALLSLKILPENEKDESGCLSQWKNKSAYISSFFVSQKDMLRSVLRVTGDKTSDWTITTEDVKQRYSRGMKMMKEGKTVGFGVVLYSRIFFKDGAGDVNDKLDNAKLGLPQEELDEATKVAIRMAGAGDTNEIK